MPMRTKTRPPPLHGALKKTLHERSRFSLCPPNSAIKPIRLKDSLPPPRPLPSCAPHGGPAFPMPALPCVPFAPLPRVFFSEPFLYIILLSVIIRQQVRKYAIRYIFILSSNVYSLRRHHAPRFKNAPLSAPGPACSALRSTLQNPTPPFNPHKCAPFLDRNDATQFQMKV